MGSIPVWVMLRTTKSPALRCWALFALTANFDSILQLIFFYIPKNSIKKIMAIYGYARYSTNENKQDINKQKRELKALCGVVEKNIYWEYESGTKVGRIELNKLLERVTEEDTIVATEVSRITRSTKQLCEIIESMKKKHLILDTYRWYSLDSG